MKVNAIAIRYARALIKLMGTDDVVVKQNMEVFKSLNSLFEIKEATDILKSPVMPLKLKADLLALAFKKTQTAPAFTRFIDVILSSQRVQLIPEIFLAYKQQMDVHHNILHAHITFSGQVKEEHERELKSQLERLFRKKVEVSKSINPDLLGGYVVKIGHYLLDSSLKTKIETLINNAAAVQEHT
jgi:F-type H+-transporting ATPase subunit delta